MVGFLYSLWAKVEELGGIIKSNKYGHVQYVVFPDEATAKEFMDTAPNQEIWFDALSNKVRLDQTGTMVTLSWPS